MACYVGAIIVLLLSSRLSALSRHLHKDIRILYTMGGLAIKISVFI